MFKSLLKVLLIGNFCPAILLATAMTPNKGLILLQGIEGFRSNETSSVAVEISIQELQKGALLSQVSYLVMHQGHEKSLLKQLGPEEHKGNYLLMVDSAMWFMGKNAKRAIRITPQQRLLGGASHADLAKFGYSQDYEVSIAEASATTTTLRLIAKKDGLAYATIELTCDPKKMELIRGDFFSLSGQKIKTASYHNYKSFGDVGRRPEKIVIKDLLFGKDLETVISYKSIQRKEFPSKYFNLNYLRNLP